MTEGRHAKFGFGNLFKSIPLPKSRYIDGGGAAPGAKLALKTEPTGFSG